MRDTNISRKSDRAQKLSDNQYKRRVGRIKMLGLGHIKIDSRPIFYYTLILEGFLDFKRIQSSEFYKFPLAVMLFGTSKLMEYLSGVRAKGQEDENSFNHYFQMMQIETHICSLSHFISFWLCGALKEEHVRDQIHALQLIQNHIINLAVIHEIDFSHLRYLAVMFGRDFDAVTHSKFAANVERLESYRKKFVTAGSPRTGSTATAQSFFRSIFEEKLAPATLNKHEKMHLKKLKNESLLAREKRRGPTKGQSRGLLGGVSGKRKSQKELTHETM
jgi:hypothetical protein